ncbi:hypothetical protein [Massilia genomosp. 1]|uniref:Uncharacterized protein n=1 Tax=Massilia genomosp. 1 TaxID=2609280 RepID=A0ABX0MQG2_9BURK|nr:hypothetical protein [Massilia genomosp. 1]NHZ64616.1 hypothetical protein [Massilia genomosp. 1]
MSTTWKAAKKCGQPQPDSCCGTDCTSGIKNRYFSGKRLTPDALRVEQDYQVERRRLLNRAMHGWGVVYGYPVALAAAASGAGTADGRLAIGAGLALDRMGRELLQTGQLVVALDDMLELPGGTGDCWLLRVHYAERLVAPVSVTDACSGERAQWDHVCETVRYSLQQVPCAACCKPQACELACGCAGGPCCERQLDDRGQAAQDMPHDARAGAACCLCDHLAALQPGAECSALTEVDEGLRVDLRNGVALACIELGMDECKRWIVKEVSDACGPRRLVKRNDLLFDLIRGCDLTHINFISWENWLAPGYIVDWDDFEACFAPERSRPLGGCITTFEVGFSRPVRKASVTPDCFALRFLIRQREGGWLVPMRAPIVRIDFADTDPDLATGASLVVGWGWVSDAVRGLQTEFEGTKVGVEIEIRGDHILDCNGQAVDANARGHSGAPTGNGTPGGTYLSHFTVGEKPAKPDPDQLPALSTDNGGITS